MPRVRKLEISNFRAIERMIWLPNEGLNCIIGPGDSGKSTVLDALDWCLGARRSLQVTDSDFHNLDITKEIRIDVTVGDLTDELSSIESYGLFHRAMNRETGDLVEEPEVGLETVLTLRLAVSSDLEPVWCLLSDRGTAQSSNRSLTWADRQRIAPTRLGSASDTHLSWRRGSVLTRLTDERADATAALAQAAREARAKFGSDAEAQLQQALDIVKATASDLGIGLGDRPQALLDSQATSFSNGTIALHDETGVPLSNLGTGSSRLLVAGLQRKAAALSSVILVDELEYGLEPHRIIRFLGSLGAKDTPPPLQAFMTTHSPVAVRELSGDQLYVVRRRGHQHTASKVGRSDAIQGTVRAYPDALLARSILVCEGASEVGLLRGIDQHAASVGGLTLLARGCCLVDGGGVSKIVGRALAFAELGYRVAILRDDDQQPKPEDEVALLAAGGQIFKWQPGHALEDELFQSLDSDAVKAMFEAALETVGDQVIDDQLKIASINQYDRAAVLADFDFPGPSNEVKELLGRTARGKAAPWFKSVGAMERLGRDIVGPAVSRVRSSVREVITSIYTWARDA